MNWHAYCVPFSGFPGTIFVQTGELLMTGDFAKVRVTGALEYDLIGVLGDEYTE